MLLRGVNGMGKILSFLAELESGQQGQNFRSWCTSAAFPMEFQPYPISFLDCKTDEGAVVNCPGTPCTLDQSTSYSSADDYIGGASGVVEVTSI